MNHLDIRRAKKAGYVATILLQLTIHLDNLEIADLVINGNEVLAQVLTNTWI